MPMAPPVFGGTRPRKPWAPVVGRTDRRRRGRAGQRDRAQVLAEEPFCRRCLEEDGKRVASDEVDHIKPLSEGGEDVRSNKQALCKPCHDAKSKRERAEAREARAEHD